MRGLIIYTDKTYEVKMIKDFSELWYYIGGFLMCTRLKKACYDGRLPSGLCIIHKEVKVYKELVPINEYATKIINSSDSLDSFVLGNVFIVEEDSNNTSEFMELSDLNLERFLINLENAGMKEKVYNDNK